MIPQPTDVDLSLHPLFLEQVLIVEADSRYASYLRSQLHQLGIRNTLCSNSAPHALDLARQHTLSAVLCNLDLPDLEVPLFIDELRRICDQPELALFLYTEEIERNQVQALVDAGIHDLMVRPLTRERLRQRLLRVTRRTTPQDTLLPATATTSARPTILVVDDVADNLLLINRVLKASYQLKLVKSGETALQICQSDTPPDLLLLDVMMPSLDGFEVAQRLRDDPQTESIPIVFMTALDDSYARRRALRLGAVDFITKPIDTEMLQLRVGNLLRRMQLRHSLQRDFDQQVTIRQMRQQLNYALGEQLQTPLAELQQLVSRLPAGMMQAEIQQRLTTCVEHLTAATLLSQTPYQSTPQPLQLRQLATYVEAGMAQLCHRWPSKGLRLTLLPLPEQPQTLPQPVDSALLTMLLQRLLAVICPQARDGSEIEFQLTATTEAVCASLRTTLAHPFMTQIDPMSGISTQDALQALAAAIPCRLDQAFNNGTGITRFTLSWPITAAQEQPD